LFYDIRNNTPFFLLFFVTKTLPKDITPKILILQPSFSSQITTADPFQITRQLAITPYFRGDETGVVSRQRRAAQAALTAHLGTAPDVLGVHCGHWRKMI